MHSQATTVAEYLQEVPDERKEVFSKLREAIVTNIPEGFEEEMNYGMIGYVVPHSLYPEGYHCDPSLPLPFASIASQKNSINFYHSGIYADQQLHDWFVDEYQKRCDHKLDMGKSCIRWTKTKTIPYDLIGELVKKISAQQWIKTYEQSRAR